jgi:hypothetical protein
MAGQPTITGIKADQELVTALLYVLNEKVARAVFLEGHQEETLGVMHTILERCGYVVSTVNLAMADIPDDTILLISAAPKNDFLAEEIQKLEHYLSSGGNAMIFYDTTTPSLPQLDEFLAVWGISVENQLVCDDQASVLSQLNLVTAPIRAGFQPSLSAAEAIGVPAILFNARPITSEWAGETRGRFTSVPVIETYASAYAKDISGGNITTLLREEGDRQGPFTLAVGIRQITYDENSQPVHSNLFVSSIGLVNDNLLLLYGQSFYSMYLIYDLVTDLNPFGQSIYIAPKQLFSELMPVTAGQQRMVLIVLVILLPLVILAAGLLIWRKRRHR